MASIVWTGAAGDNNFNNAANWSPAQVPGVGDSVTIDPASAVNISLANDAVGALTTAADVTLTLANGTSFTIGSAAGGATSFSNGGTFVLGSTGYGTDLFVGGPSLTLTGGGTVMLSDNANNDVTGSAAGDVLNNVNNLIEGGGALGGGTLTFINGAGGVVDATGGNALVLNTGTAATTNAGLLESSNTGGLVIESLVNDGTTGVVSAAAGDVYLQGGTLAGGIIKTSAGFAVLETGGGTLDGTANAVTNSGSVVLVNGTALGVLGTLTNNGTVLLASTGYGTTLEIGPGGTTKGTVTLGGTGVVVMSDNANNAITGAGSADTLLNKSDTIEGAGAINGTLTLNNQSVIDATGGNALVLATSNAVTNSKLLEATVAGGGGLVIDTVIKNTANGTLLAAGGNVYLTAATIYGGVLKTSGGGLIDVNGSATLNGTTLTVTNLGTVAVNDSDGLSLAGTITNQGTIELNSTGRGTGLAVVGSVTLTGGGTVLLSDEAPNVISAAATGAVLTDVNNLIEGSGQLGGGTLTLINSAAGIVDATGSNNALVLNTASTQNSGLLEATGPGGLDIETVVSGSGTLLAAGGNIYLVDGGTVQGGTIVSSGGGAFIEAGGASIGGTLDGTANAVTNIGLIAVQQGTAMDVLGTISNAGTILLNSFGYGTDLVIGSTGATPGTVTLTGKGILTTSDNANNSITAGVAGDTLLNLNNTIEGAVTFGGSLTLINDATINANDGNVLVLNTGNVVTNNGLLEATLAGGGGLVIDDTVNNSGGGTLLAAGGDIYLFGGTLIGGTLESSGGGALFDANGTLNGAMQAVTNLGTVVVDQGRALYVDGTISNSGTILLNSAGYGTDLVIETPTLTLTGGGTVLLTDNANNNIYGAVAGDVLDNVNNVIEGAGQLGDGQMVFVNEAGGLVNADGGNVLIINTGTNTVLNSGIFEATGPGGLEILNTTVSNGTVGKISVNGGNVIFSGATIEGGTLAAPGAGAFIDAGSTTLDGSATTVVNLGTVDVDQGVALYALGTLTNHGTIALNSFGYGTDLVIGPSGTAGTFVLTGGGQVVLTDNTNNLIEGAIAGDTLVNLNNTISGAGVLGAMNLVNDATINADGTNTLVVDTGAVVVNNALFESTNTGGLVIESVMNDMGGGTLGAYGGNVILTGATIEGGTLASSGGGVFVETGASTLDGSQQAIVNDAEIIMDQGLSMYALGTLSNVGTVVLNSAGYGTALVVGPAGKAGTFTLTGGGQVILSDNTNNSISAEFAKDTLLNLNNTISGAGVIGGGGLVLINDATIDATGLNSLTISSTSAATNNGLIEVTNTGGLIIGSVIKQGTGGMIAATAGNVSLQGGTVQSGTLTSGAGFGFILTGGATLSGAGHALTNLASVTVQNGTTGKLTGAIVNDGTIGLGSTGYGTDLILTGSRVTLSGTGTLAMTDNANNVIYGTAVKTVLADMGNTIEGAGNLGNGELSLIDAGTIEATGANALIIDLGSTGTITAAGKMLGVGAGGLSLDNGVFTNSGLIEAEDGSSVVFQSTATLANSQNGTLTSGNYEAVDGGHGATLSVTGQAVSVDAANIVISGAGAVIEFGGKSLDATLDDVTAKAKFSLLNGANFTVGANAGVFTDNGSMTLGGGTFTGSTLNIAQGAQFSGFGTLQTAVVNNGTITITGGQLIFDGPVSGTGTIVTGKDGILVLMGGGSLMQTYSGTGTLELASGSYTLGSSPPTISTIEVDAGATLSGAGTLSNTLIDAGTLAAMGGTLTLDSALTGAGTVAADAGATLEIAGGANFAGAISGAGTVLIDSVTMLDMGASIAAAEVIETADVTLATGESLTNQAGKVFMLTANNAPGAPHRVQVELNGASGDSFTNMGSLVANGTGLATIGVAFDNMGQVAVTAGDLRLTGALSGSGAINISAGAKLDLAGAGNYGGAIGGAGSVLIQGLLKLNAGATLNAAKVVEQNNLLLGTGESLTNQAGNQFYLEAAGAGDTPHRVQIEVKGGAGDIFTNAGGVLANGAGTAEFGVNFVNNGSVSANAGTLAFLNVVSGSGKYSVATGAVLDLAAGGTVAGAVTGAGALLIGGDTTLNAGAKIAVAAVTDGANLTLGTGVSLNNAAGDVFTLVTGDAALSDPPHRVQIEINGGSGSSFSNAGTLAENGTATAIVGVSMINSGDVAVSSGTLTFAGSVANNGLVNVTGGLAVFDTQVTGKGMADIGAGATLSYVAGAVATQGVDFMAGTGLLDLTAPSSFLGTIAGFGGGDQIDLIKTAASSLSFSGGVLTVKSGGTVEASLHFSGSYSTADFALSSDGNGGHFITFV